LDPARRALVLLAPLAAMARQGAALGEHVEDLAERALVAAPRGFRAAALGVLGGAPVVAEEEIAPREQQVIRRRHRGIPEPGRTRRVPEQEIHDLPEATLRDEREGLPEDEV